jgi:phytoene dehydrogenase-like protein
MAADIIIIGGGLNGLVTACYLARAGLKPIVLERRATAGGAFSTEEFYPGFHASLANTVDPLLPQIFRELQLERFGLELITPAVRVSALNLDGLPVTIHEDTAKTAAELNRVSSKDSHNYPEFVSTFARIGSALAPLMLMTPPDIDRLSSGEIWQMGRLGLSIRGLGKKDEYRLLRYGPMAIADLAAEWFENELVRSVVAARGIFGAFAGPWSAGTSAAVLLQAATDGNPLAPSHFVKGGMGALSNALAKAAAAAGAVIRTNSQVVKITVQDGQANGVILATGEEIPARAVVSNADPKSTFLTLLEAAELDPSFITKIHNYRAHGTVAKVHLALSGLPAFVGMSSADAQERLSGRIHIGPEIDYLERAFDDAKYGNFSTAPFLDFTIPTLKDPSPAPAGAHVMSIHAQFAPHKLHDGDWEARREALGTTVVDTLSDYAPNLKQLIVGQQVITPLDLEREYGLTGGHINHGEMSLDQLFAFRPLIGWARYRTPIKGLYLCGAGTHPGGGVTGASGFNASREIIKDLKRTR